MATDSKPIALEDFEQALEDLPEDTLTSVRSQLENSVSKLKSTNLELQQEIDSLRANEDPQSQEDIKLYQSIIEENEQVIQSQTSRIQLIIKKLQQKGLLPPEQSHDHNESDNNEVYL